LEQLTRTVVDAGVIKIWKVRAYRFLKKDGGKGYEFHHNLNKLLVDFLSTAQLTNLNLRGSSSQVMSITRRRKPQQNNRILHNAPNVFFALASED